MMLFSVTLSSCLFNFKNSKTDSEVKNTNVNIDEGIEINFYPKNTNTIPTADQLEQIKDILIKRLGFKKIAGNVNVDKEKKQIIVQIPWKLGNEIKPQSAIEELSQVANLSFVDPDDKIIINSSNVISATTKFDEQIRGQDYYFAELSLNSEGSSLIKEATSRLIGKQITIKCDERIISSPKIQSQIDTGKVQIPGIDSEESAKDFANLINSGTLPFELNYDWHVFKK